MISSCVGNEKQDKGGVKPLADETPVDTTIYGHSLKSDEPGVLRLATSGADITVHLGDADNMQCQVHGGVMLGDHMAVIAHKTSEGKLTATKVINLTTLLGTWRSLEATMRIEDGGVLHKFYEAAADSTNNGGVQSEWNIFNGKLVLGEDTFDVYLLNADSLLVENTFGIYAFERERK